MDLKTFEKAKEIAPKIYFHQDNICSAETAINIANAIQKTGGDENIRLTIHYHRDFFVTEKQSQLFISPEHLELLGTIVSSHSKDKIDELMKYMEELK